MTELDPSRIPPYYGTCSIFTSFISSENGGFRNQICNRYQWKYPCLVFLVWFGHFQSHLFSFIMNAREPKLKANHVLGI